MSGAIAEREQYNPCPKCGDDNDMRVARVRVEMGGGEYIDVRCLACGALLGTVHPLDHPTNPGEPL